MTRKLTAYVLLTIMLVAAIPNTAMALGYTGKQGNEATFETLEETRESSPEAVANLENNAGKIFVSHPVLDGYPEGTTFIYRSANLFGGRAAARLNTNLLVFSDQHFDNKDAALAYLKTLGVIDIIDEAIGSVTLVTPADPETGFGQADQKNYYALQTAICAQKAGGMDAEGNRIYYSDAEYFGGYGYIYVVGLDGGATFLNNYVASTFDYVSRIAGLLLVNGRMDAIRQVAAMVPVYLANASDEIIGKYKMANETDAYEATDKAVTYFNQALPLQRVVVAQQQEDAAAYIHDAYYDLFIKAMRVPVLKAGLYTASTPYQGYSFDQAPYSLYERNAVINDVTADGIHVICHTEDRFSEFITDEGEYLQTWFEYLPDDVLNGTAPAGSVPLILANHGTGDDPRLFVDEIGLLDLAGSERFVIVAPEHDYIGGEQRVIELQALPLLVEYMLETYPSLDASRVYTMGYSMGAGGTLKAVYGNPSLFAAAAPLSPIPGYPGGRSYQPTDEEMTVFNGVNIPILFSTSGYDLANTYDPEAGGITEAFQEVIDRFVQINNLPPISSYNFDDYKHCGFKADRIVRVMINNEFENITWYLNDSNGVPMVALNYTEGLVHALYPGYGAIAWDFLKHYSRNVETGEIVYNPYVH